MSHGCDQRLQARFSMAGVGGMTAALNARRLSRAVRVAVNDISLGGAGLFVSSLEPLGEVDLSLSLGRQDWVPGETRVEPVHVCAAAGPGKQQLVGVRFRRQGERFMRRLCRYLVRTFGQPAGAASRLQDRSCFSVVDDAVRIRRLLVHCCRRRRTLWLHDESGARCGQFKPRMVRDGRLLGHVLNTRRSWRPRPGAPCHMVLPSFTALEGFPSAVVDVQGSGLVAFATPRTLVHGGVRRLGRLDVVEEFPVLLELLHPLIPGLVLRKQVHELGLGGLRFELDLDRDLLAPGTVIPSAALRLPDGQSVACSAVVRHTAQRDGGRSCGVELTAFQGDGRRVWARAVLPQINPDVEEASPFRLQEVWDLFSRSGYLEEKPEQQLASMRGPFVRTWSQLLGQRRSALCWLYRKERRAVGTVSVSRLYQDTWLVHHLAVDPALGAARKLLVLSDLCPHTAFQWLAAVEPESTVVGYFDATRSFNQGAWLGFLGREANASARDLRHMRLWELPLRQLAAAAGEGSCGPIRLRDFSVENAGEADLGLISAELLRREGTLVHRAFDLQPERLCPGPETGDGMQRSRRAVVARRGQELIGFGLLERARPGTNIFALYDTCRSVVLDSAGDAASRVRAALVRAMARQHLEAGGTALLYVDAAGAPPPPGVDRLFCAEAIRAVFPVSLVPQFVDFLESIWAQV